MLLILRYPTDTPAAWQGTRTAHYNLPDAQGTQAKIRGRGYGPHPGGETRSIEKSADAANTNSIPQSQQRRSTPSTDGGKDWPRQAPAFHGPQNPLSQKGTAVTGGGGLGWPTQRLAPHFVRPTAHPWLTSPLGEGGKRVHAAEPVADNQEAHEVKIKGHQHRFKPAQPT